MRLFPHVYLLTGPVYGTHQNVYAVRGAEGLVLVDSGKGLPDLAILDRTLAYWGLDKLPLSAVVLTHEHYEHAANARALQRRGAKLYATRACADALLEGGERVADYAYPFDPPFETVAVDCVVQDLETFTVDGLSFECLCVPGHSAGSAVYSLLLDDRELLFTGDVIIPQMLCSTCATGWTGSMDYDRLQLLDSITRLSAGHTDALLAGHGELCLREGQQLLREAVVKARQSLKHAAIYEPLKEA